MLRCATRPQDSITNRYFRRVFGLFIGFAVLLTLVLIGEALWQSRLTLKTELVVFERTFERSLATALWALDWEKLDSITSGIMEIPAIRGLRITTPDGQVEILHRGALPSASHQDNGYWLAHEFMLINDDGFGREHIGDVTIYSSFEHLWHRSKRQVAVIVLLGFIKTLVLALIFLTIGRRMLTRPLNEIAHSISLTTTPQHIQLSALAEKTIRGTELDALRQAYDNLTDRIQTSQKQLRQANQHLEDRVLQRTEELKSANKQLEALAHTDPLTGLANRRQLLTDARTLMALSRRSNSPLSLIVCDIDSFKQVNDTHGHELGDRAICLVADCMRKAVREIDVVARFGGDEFVLLLPGIGSRDAQIVAHRLNELVRTATITDEKGQQLKLTLSCGIGQWQKEDSRFEDLFLRADRNLYAAKNSGRNQTVANGDPATALPPA